MQSSTITSLSKQELPPVPSNIGAIAGPPLIGIMLNWFLYGILVMQIYVYYQWFPNDKKMIKCLVYGLFFLDTLQSFLIAADAFHWFAKGFGNMITLSQPFISPFDAPTLDGVIAFIVQSFFCWRIWVLCKSLWLPLAILGVSLVSIAGAIATGVGGYQIPNLTQLIDLKWQLSLWLGGGALSDTLIAVVMTYVLLRSRSPVHVRTNNVLVKIVRLTVETNTATASLAIVALVCLFTIPQNSSITMTPGYALGKMYSNTLLAIFNNRIYMKRGMNPTSAVPSTDIDFDFHHPTQQYSQEISPSHSSTEGEPYHLEYPRKAYSKFPTNIQIRMTSNRVINKERENTEQFV